MRLRARRVVIGGAAVALLAGAAFLVTNQKKAGLKVPTSKVPAIGQEASLWCWAASGEMIMKAWMALKPWKGSRAPDQVTQVFDFTKEHCPSGCYATGRPKTCDVPEVPNFVLRIP